MEHFTYCPLVAILDPLILSLQFSYTKLGQTIEVASSATMWFIFHLHVH